MVNSNNGNILNEIVNSVASVYEWKNFYKPALKKTKPVADSIFSNYAGTYTINKDTMSLVRQGNTDYLVFASNEKYRVYFTADDEFFSKEISVDLKFEKNASGKIVGFYYIWEGKKELIKRLYE
jgi:hypothetical protein